jgi:ABC-type uncharacterized transport system permease subunit
MLSVLLTASVLGYALATLFYLRWVLTFRSELRRIASGLTALAVGVLGGAVATEFLAGDDAVLGASPRIVLLLTVALGLIFIVTKFLRDLPIAGSVLAPLSAAATVALLLKSLSPAIAPAVATMGAVTAIHIGAALLGFVLFIPSYVLSILFLAQEHRLKTKKPGETMLPGLLAVESNAWRLLYIGFPLYSVGILLGLLWQDSAEHGSGVKPQHVIAAFSWVVYAVAIYLRVRIGWRGRRAAITVMSAFVTTFSAVLLYMMR